MEHGSETSVRVIGAAYLAGAVFIMALAWLGRCPVGSHPGLRRGFCVSGAQIGLSAFAPSCYPTAARATGVSWMLGMGRFGSIVGSLVGGALLGLGWVSAPSSAFSRFRRSAGPSPSLPSGPLREDSTRSGGALTMSALGQKQPLG